MPYDDIALNPPQTDILERIRSKQAKIGIIGLGYVGLPLAVEFARAGFDVTGFGIAAADIAAKAVSDNRLAVDADGIPHPSHANIVGWPGSRSAQKLVAIRLAEAAVCVFRSR